MIGSFHKGLAEGLVREWDVQGNLTSVSFYQQGFKIGKCWAKFGNWLIYQDCSTSGENKKIRLCHKIYTYNLKCDENEVKQSTNTYLFQLLLWMFFHNK
jgi:hypothetical protein